MPPENAVSSLMSVLAGSGFKHFADGTSKLAQSGVDVNELFSQPMMPMLLAGAGLKDSANSLEALAPFVQMLFPPQPPPPENSPQEIKGALSMLSARLAPGNKGLQAPGGGMPGGGMPMGGMSPMSGMSQGY